MRSWPGHELRGAAATNRGGNRNDAVKAMAGGGDPVRRGVHVAVHGEESNAGVAASGAGFNGGHVGEDLQPAKPRTAAALPVARFLRPRNKARRRRLGG